MFLLKFDYRININNIAFYTPIKKGSLENKTYYGIKFIFSEPLDQLKEDKIFYSSKEERDEKLIQLDKLVQLIKL